MIPLLNGGVVPDAVEKEVSATNGDIAFTNAYAVNPAGRIFGETAANFYTIGQGKAMSDTLDADPVNIFWRSRHLQFLYTTNDLAAMVCAGAGRVTVSRFCLSGKKNRNEGGSNGKNVVATLVCEKGVDRCGGVGVAGVGKNATDLSKADVGRAFAYGHEHVVGCPGNLVGPFQG